MFGVKKNEMETNKLKKKRLVVENKHFIPG